MTWAHVNFTEEEEELAERTPNLSHFDRILKPEKS